MMASGRRLKFDLLGHIQGVVHLNSKISDGAFQLRMAEEELHRAEIAGLTINLGRPLYAASSACHKRSNLSRCF
jgi:hypothetical protein